eukprot:2683684-Amphidinium_carterae.1
MSVWLSHKQCVTFLRCVGNPPYPSNARVCANPSLKMRVGALLRLVREICKIRHGVNRVTQLVSGRA